MLTSQRVSPPRGSGRKEEAGMPTYVALMNWTDQGVRTDKDTVHRREQADALAEKHGARIEQVYWTMGHYDIVAILEAPDDETVTAMMLELGSAGNLRTATLRAYDHDQMQAIIQRLG
jgi:uncharacterized protein with GYD domain